MKILFMHNNFPGQYRRLLEYLKGDRTVRCAVATLESNAQKAPYPRVDYKPHRKPTEKIHPAVRSTEEAVILGQAAYKSLMPMKQKGGSPDIILSHSGWGGNLFLRDVFPDAKLLTYFEWYYHCHGGDSEFFEDEPHDANAEIRMRMKNTPILHDLAAMDWGQCPTAFQHSKFPEIFQKNISVLHDGVDVEFFSPKDTAKLKVPGGKILTKDDEVITYIGRGMEEYRGFPQFMESVSILMKERPNLQVVIMGTDRISYGARKADGTGLKKDMLEKFDYDMDRLHFMGHVPLHVMRGALRISKAHIYLTAPFVLSWSMLESMSTGALVIGSDTDPVKELISHEQNGLLVDFFDVGAQVAQINAVLDDQAAYQPLRDAARKTITDSYDVKDLLPKYKKLIDCVANGQQVSL